MLQVEPGLYIGTAEDLNHWQRLAEAAVSHILTVDSEDPAPRLPADGRFQTKWLNVLDDPISDLLSHMDDSFLFIQEAVEAGGAALVHCQAGRSRSATMVTAFLMKKHQLGFQEAYSRLRSQKQDVQLNRGFEQQLCVYESLGWEVNRSSSLYRHFQLQLLRETHTEMQQVPKEMFVSDPAHSASSEVSYRCRKCRRTLFRNSSVLSHPVGGGASAFGHKRTSSLSAEVSCTSFFIEPVQWMESALLGVMSGQLLCPQCSSKLGSFSWMGAQCSCGRWITPAFQLHRTRLDRIQPR